MPLGVDNLNAHYKFSFIHSAHNLHKNITYVVNDGDQGAVDNGLPFHQRSHFVIRAVHAGEQDVKILVVEGCSHSHIL